MQRLGFANVHTVEAIVPHWERGEAEFAVLAPCPQTMPTLALGGSVGTGNEGIEADAVMVKDLDALAALPAGAVKDKIVFFSNRMERTRDGSGYGKAVAVRAAGPVGRRRARRRRRRDPLDQHQQLALSAHRRNALRGHCTAHSGAGDLQSGRRRARASIRKRQARATADQEQLARPAARRARPT